MTRRLRRFSATFLILAAAACGRSPAPPPPAPEPVPLPDPAAVESVIFLLGDAGDGHTDLSPVLPRLQQDVEYWSARLESDSSVAILVLGDIVYPWGVNSRDHPSFGSDTSVVMSQVRLVTGPAALQRGARMIFMAGNHDWSRREDRESFVRLLALDEVLQIARAADGAAVELLPPAGTGGPTVVDIGSRLRVLVLDTAWWLLSGDGAEKAAVLAGIDEAMATAGDRHVMLASHHPFKSVGPHGGTFPFWRTAGLRYILARSGAILQDLTSVPYREMEDGLRTTFSRLEPPLAFIGGHEHSLQVIEGVEPTDPLFNLVSGSGSKLTEVGYEEGLRFAAAWPGYMRMVIEKSGGVALFVEAAPPEYLRCEGSEEAIRACMLEGVTAFRTVYSQRLR